MKKETMTVNPEQTNTTTEGEMNVETQTTIEQVQRPVSPNENLEVTGAVMVVNKRANVAALAGAAAFGSAFGAGTFFVTTLASRKLTRELTQYLLAYVNQDKASLEAIIKKNPNLGTLEHLTLFDFTNEMDIAMKKATVGWKNPFGASKKQIDEIQSLVAAAFAAKSKQLLEETEESQNVTTVDKAVEEIEVKDNKDNKDNA